MMVTTFRVYVGQVMTRSRPVLHVCLSPDDLWKVLHVP